MSISIQFQTMAFMSLCGIFMGMGFDTYHVIKGKGRFPLWAVFILDLLFWLSSVGIVFYVLVWVNDGIVRFPIYLGIIIGAWLYFLIGSKVYIRFLLTVLEWSIWVFQISVKFIDFLLIKPIEIIFHFIWIILGFLFTVLAKIGLFIWRIISWPLSPFVPWGRNLWKSIRGKMAGAKEKLKKWFTKENKE
ncbi:spore cortex biosynthesis protein YabQ [Brevibacillus sp. 7WMA2]|uniref:Spore protein YabQ n=1 Tax=Brevibacillus laterosporus LMG 15441 TaxID=1042163 RepID=A0A075R4E4_BRELA|nr:MULTISPECIES: spore cortex biosynthesis protein YabQ [Brevibacillus]MBA4534299.1 spore cortex biosynthesis protein YabQ [Brevibacillus halotolerans]AIG24500.1 spore protein YabQ [Brevibacillus laterosporus LMG 15441]AUM63147.1 spore cortex biosynthesis protein YabQ [Brevibacillus laterosporus]AYK06174.1 spore cortex biosynthesis protein YabQ [Brevibacillus laterosporus]MCR8965235.1 spore cortex biosynthesis protein YabQ [Brevibacillus laterosporus]